MIHRTIADRYKVLRPQMTANYYNDQYMSSRNTGHEYHHTGTVAGIGHLSAKSISILHELLVGHGTVAATTGTTNMVPYLQIKSLAATHLNLRLGTCGFHLWVSNLQISELQILDYMPR